jgi:dienelactone hydrolase
MRSLISHSRNTIRLLLAGAALIYTGGHAWASDWPGGLEPGAYAVGFETVERYDYSRTIRGDRDYFGEPIPGETARPIQVCIWYPAEAGADWTPMVYGQYNFPYPGDERFMAYLSRLQDREIDVLHRALRGDRGFVLDVLSFDVVAAAEAPALPGPFPLILYAPDLGRGMAENAALCELIASHGFVVAGTHSVGAQSLQPELGARDLSAQRGDLQFVLRLMKSDARCDPGQLGVVGAGAGGTAAVMLALRDSRVDAVACLAGAAPLARFRSLVKDDPYFDPARMRAALLVLDSEGYDWTLPALADELTYTDLFLLRAPIQLPVGMTQYSLLAAMRADSAISPDVPKVYARVCERTCSFFATELGDSTSPPTVQSDYTGFTVAHREGSVPPPNSEQFRQILQVNGATRAAELWAQYNLAASDPPLIAESVLNNMGYGLLRADAGVDAITVFRMCAEAYPNSANAWDSYAEACLNTGDEARALELYRRALEVLPQDTTTSPDLKEQIRSHATEAIERLQDTEP